MHETLGLVSQEGHQTGQSCTEKHWPLQRLHLGSLVSADQWARGMERLPETSRALPLGSRVVPTPSA